MMKVGDGIHMHFELKSHQLRLTEEMKQESGFLLNFGQKSLTLLNGTKLAKAN